MYKLRRLCGEMSEKDHTLKKRTMWRRSGKQIFTDALRLFVQDVKDKKTALVLVAAYLLFSEIFLRGICPLVLLTGFPCPGCGLTRAGIAMLRFRFREAWQMHPFIYAVAVYAVFYMAGRYLFQKREQKGLRYVAIVLLLAGILYYIVRMFFFFPGEPPMEYHRDNLLFHVLSFLQFVE